MREWSERLDSCSRLARYFSQRRSRMSSTMSSHQKDTDRRRSRFVLHHHEADHRYFASAQRQPLVVGFRSDRRRGKTSHHSPGTNSFRRLCDADAKWQRKLRRRPWRELWRLITWRSATSSCCWSVATSANSIDKPSTTSSMRLATGSKWLYCANGRSPFNKISYLKLNISIENHL